MSDEASIHTSLFIKNSPLEYQSRPTNFTANVSGTKGPTPAAIEVTTGGTDVDLSELTTPGLCRLMNLDDENYVTYGIWDGVAFHELGELLAGETYVLRLSRSIGDGTGTGYENLRVKADTASVQVLVEAFEV